MQNTKAQSLFTARLGTVTLAQGLTWVLGVAVLSALAQIRITLPFTPVPITGQTFGVALISLLLGRKQAVAVVGSYLFMGVAGLPILAGVFALPTLGYLVGMGVAAFVVGGLSDRGWNQSFGRAWSASALGSICVFFFGALGLSFFLPLNQVLVAGVLPFLPGDLLKTTLAAGIASRAIRGAGKWRS